MPQLDEVIDRHPGSRPVVVRHRVDGPGSRVPGHQHHRHDRRGGSHLAPRKDRSGQDHPIGSQVEQGLQGHGLPFGQAAARIEQGPVAGADGRLLHPVHHLGEERIVQVREQDPDQVAAFSDQASGHLVRSVLELLRRLKDGGAFLLAHLGCSPHDQRHQRLGHAGPLGHVEDGGVGSGHAGHTPRR
jgi:hypothetical protein